MIYKNSKAKFYVLMLLLLLLASQLFNSKQIVLFKQKIISEKDSSGNGYFLKLNIANLKVNLHATFNMKNTWLKSDKCQLCSMSLTQTQNSQNSLKNFQCQESCFNNQEQYGVKCIKSHCTEISKVQNESFIISGQKVELQAISQQNLQKSEKLKIKLKSILIQKMLKDQNNKKKLNQEYQYDGEYALLGEGSIFSDSFILKSITQNKVSSEIITIYDNKNQITNFIIQNDETSVELDSLEDPQEKAVSFEFMQFGISQIKIVDLPNINHDQLFVSPIEMPINPFSKGIFSLDTQKLHLPSKHFHKFVEQIIKNFFTSLQSSSNICQYSQGSITCSQQISLQKIQYTQLQLVVNGATIKFPLKILIRNCKQKSCQFLIAKSQKFIIGQFILNAFAISYSSQSNNQLNLMFHRLDNQFGKMYKSNQKYNKQKLSVIWWIISAIYFLIYYFFKCVFYLAIFSILINCCVHWRKVLNWISQICNKIQRKYNKNNKSHFLGDQQDKDTSKLINKNWSRSTLPSMQDQQSISEV